MTLEDLGYKHIEEEPYLSYFRVRYRKDITVYEIDGQKIPEDKLMYRYKTIMVFNDLVEHTENEPLTFDEMRALLEMREKGEFNKIRR